MASVGLICRLTGGRAGSDCTSQKTKKKKRSVWESQAISKYSSSKVYLLTLDTSFPLTRDSVRNAADGDRRMMSVRHRCLLLSAAVDDDNHKNNNVNVEQLSSVCMISNYRCSIVIRPKDNTFQTLRSPQSRERWRGPTRIFSDTHVHTDICLDTLSHTHTN